MREAIIIAYFRGLITKRNTQRGGMAAIGLGTSAASAHLLDGVVIACENSPSSVTISGDIDPLREVMASIKAQHPDALVRQLKVDMAYHSGKYSWNSASASIADCDRSHGGSCIRLC